MMMTFSATGASLTDNVLCVIRCCNWRTEAAPAQFGKEQLSRLHLHETPPNQNIRRPLKPDGLPEVKISRRDFAAIARK